MKLSTKTIVLVVCSLISGTSAIAQKRELDKEKVEQTAFPYEYTYEGNIFQITKEDLESETISKYVMSVDDIAAKRLIEVKQMSIKKRIDKAEETKTAARLAIASNSIPKSIFLQVYARYQANLVASGIDKKSLTALSKAQEAYVSEGKTPKEMMPYIQAYIDDLDAEIADLTRIMNLQETEEILSIEDFKNSTITFEPVLGSGSNADYYRETMFQRTRKIYQDKLQKYEIPSRSSIITFPNPFWKEVVEEKNELEYPEWAWLNDKLEEVNKSYPEPDSYLVHKEHPEYKVRGIRYVGWNVFKGDELVYVKLDAHASGANFFNPNDKFVMAIMKKAYQENRYNFKRESEDAQMVVKVRTGLFYDQMQEELMECILGKRYFIQSDMAQYSEMTEADFRKMCEPANRYEEQLHEDYKSQLESIRIKRISNTSFIYYSADGTLEIKEEWFDFGKSTCTVVKY